MTARGREGREKSAEVAQAARRRERMKTERQRESEEVLHVDDLTLCSISHHSPGHLIARSVWMCSSWREVQALGDWLYSMLVCYKCGDGVSHEGEGRAPQTASELSLIHI